MIIYMEQTIALINQMQDMELIGKLNGRLTHIQKGDIGYFKLVENE